MFVKIDTKYKKHPLDKTVSLLYSNYPSTSSNSGHDKFFQFMLSEKLMADVRIQAVKVLLQNALLLVAMILCILCLDRNMLDASHMVK